MNKEEIRQRNEKIFWDKMKAYPYDYDFSKVNYVNANEKVEVICPIHGSFYARPKHLVLEHTGCPKCRNDKFRNAKDAFIKRVNDTFNNRYDLSKFVYINNKAKSIVICPEHGEFLASPHSLYQGKGCPICGRLKSNKEEMITEKEWIERFNKIHKGKYDYSLMKYKGYKEKIEIICPQHGIFLQTPDNHYRGKGCPVCNSSKMESEVREFLIENNFNFIEQKRFKWLGFQSLDFFLPEYNIAIECQGAQHFNSIEIFEKKITLNDRIKLDVNKNKQCIKNGVKVLYIININDLKIALSDLCCGIYDNNFILRENLNILLNKIKKEED